MDQTKTSTNNQMSPEQFKKLMKAQIEDLKLKEQYTRLNASIAKNSFEEFEYTLRLLHLKSQMKQTENESSENREETSDKEQS